MDDYDTYLNITIVGLLQEMYGVDSVFADQQRARFFLNRYINELYESIRERKDEAVEQDEESKNDNGYRRGGIVGTFRKMKKNLFH
jgi:hypothetical protein